MSISYICLFTDTPGTLCTISLDCTLNEAIDAIDNYIDAKKHAYQLHSVWMLENGKMFPVSETVARIWVRRNADNIDIPAFVRRHADDELKDLGTRRAEPPPITDKPGYDGRARTPDQLLRPMRDLT